MEPFLLQKWLSVREVVRLFPLPPRQTCGGCELNRNGDVALCVANPSACSETSPADTDVCCIGKAQGEKESHAQPQRQLARRGRGPCQLGDTLVQRFSWVGAADEPPGYKPEQWPSGSLSRSLSVPGLAMAS